MAVYTEISDDELRDYLAAYEIGELHACKGIAEGVENSNFFLSTDAGAFILTLYEKRVSVEDLPFFLELMQHLAARGINCPEPIAMRSGETLGRLAGRPSAIISFLDGVSVRRPRPAHCRQVGAALARLHLAASDFPMKRQNALSIAGWRPLFEKSADRAGEVEAGLGELIEREIDALEQTWPQGLPAGVIHADLFPDNVLFLKDNLSGLIDFYFACNDQFAYDLAICINAWCFEREGDFNVTKAKALMDGYMAVRPLTEAEYASMPILCRGSALRFLLTRLFDWLNVPPGALVTPKDPLEYLVRLRFHSAIQSTDEYGTRFTPGAGSAA